MKPFRLFQKNSIHLGFDMLKQFIEQNNIAVWSYDVKKNKYNFISKKMMELFGIPKSDKNMPVEDVFYYLKLYSSFNIESIKKIIEVEEQFTHSYFLSLPNGETHTFNERIIGIKDDQNNLELIVGINEVDTAQEKDNEIIELSNLNSRRVFIKKLIEQYKSEKKITFALLKVNIYEFSTINEYYSYEVGNEIIYQTTERLNKYLENKGCLIHCNGDQWLVALYPLSKKANFLQLAKQILEIVESPFTINERKIFIGANIGVSLYPIDGNNQDDLLQHARKALKQASLKGAGNIEFYSSVSNIQSFKQFQLITDLHTAIERNELYIEYQPKVDIKSLKVTGTEALLRWKHPVWGNVSPTEFIPLAEEYQLFEAISEFVIDEVLQQIKMWKDQGIKHPNVSLNLSVDTFSNQHFFKYIQAMLNKYQIDPTCLEIEITEGVCLEDTEQVINLLNKIRSLGIRLALDDKGKGYSSLQYLVNFPFDTIKIDRSFVADLEVSKERRVVIQSILDICKKLGKRVVAEGSFTELSLRNYFNKIANKNEF